MASALPRSVRPTLPPRPSSAWLPIVAALIALIGLACAGRRIPGTEIPDNGDTRAIVAAIEAYRQAAERRDAPAVLKLVSTRYFDDGGTADPADDLDAERLAQKLGPDYAQLSGVRLTFAVRRIEVLGERAAAYVFFDEAYGVVTQGGEKMKVASDLHRMHLSREDGTWKFVSGL